MKGCFSSPEFTNQSRHELSEWERVQFKVLVRANFAFESANTLMHALVVFQK
jgi:hypothetical protein